MKRQMEHDGEDDGTEPPAKRGGSRSGGKGGKASKKGGGKNNGGLGELRRFVFKLLCTDPVAANIIGHQGYTRKQIEDDTGCSMWISKREEFFPSSKCRILILHADEAQQVFAAIECVMPRLIEVAEKDRGKEVDRDETLLGKEDGEYCFRAALPTFIRGRLIGKSGNNIKDLREKTGAKIFVENDVFEGHQAARIIGPPDRMLDALRQINDMVQDEAHTDEYGRWASVHGFPNAPTTPAGRGERPRSRDRGPPPSRREEDARGYGDSRRGGGRREEGVSQDFTPSRGHDGSAVDMLRSLPSEFPSGALDVDYAIRCDLPNSRVGALIGVRGEYVMSVERNTGTKIKIEEGPELDGVRYRTVLIAGQLMSCYAAHMMLMKKYHEKEYEESTAVAPSRHSRSPRPGGARKGKGGSGGRAEEEIQEQIRVLQEKLADVQRGGSADTGGRYRGR